MADDEYRYGKKRIEVTSAVRAESDVVLKKIATSESRELLPAPPRPLRLRIPFTWR